ncbi:TPR repeat containing exported protein; Putative periplasmic protein contains a protein prenylyltransferase domain [hydrothermal vent metagenome]|uniref:TPR repeat containing exported protein Putative periplasmic protein contains a protein prenylyltransferase domain n=1 Tax=hydrothermal vent metagenome TaxID=652676 RepID=A0A1W1BNR5_9ZZZZ
MKKTVLISTIALVTLLQANEPSVYGAGNIDSAQPYGLTATEKGVIENRKTIQNLKNMVSEQQNRIDGLTTIIEGLNKEILSLKEQVNNSSKQDPNETYNMLLEMGKMVDQINNNYVTQEDLKEVLGGGSPVKHATTISSNEENSEKNSNDISTTYRRAVQLFGQKSYQSAKQNFEETLANNYKSASSNYYLGEIAYYTQEYTDAIAYYKKSASLYDKASYMKILYLHTGISLARTGQESPAKGFFQFVIDNYPNTKAAEIAKKNL